MADEQSPGRIKPIIPSEPSNLSKDESRSQQASKQDGTPLEIRIAVLETRWETVATKEMMQQAATDRERIRREIETVRTDIQRNSKNIVRFLVTTGIAFITALVALIGAIADWF